MDRAELSRLLGAEGLLAEPRDVVVDEREPARFIDAFTDAVASGGTVFLADPTWGERERAQFNALISAPEPTSNIQRPTPNAQRPATGHPASPEFSAIDHWSLAIGHSAAARPGHSRARLRGGLGWLCIPTGGSSGNIKLARHDEETLAAAVKGLCTHFGVTKINVVGLLPLHHVSGLMAWMRTVLTGGTYVSANWKDVEAGGRPALPAVGGDWFLSLVPTQLQRLLGDPEALDWLRGFRAVFVGGGPAWPELVEAGARARLPLAFSYGMTETAAMVTALRPEEFFVGKRGNGAVLPHARLALIDGDRIAIAGASLFRGYWPETRADEPWFTGDRGRFDEDGSLHILGRRDALIITGGEKVDPAEVEATLRETGRFSDAVVIGVPDAQWGEVVVACYPAADQAGVPVDGDQVINSHLCAHLAPFKRPKRYIAIADWPRNALGKVNRAALRERVLDLRG
jgi:O-succinylbenzoic acid--CoA ligase